jgi:hypothetical protein
VPEVVLDDGAVAKCFDVPVILRQNHRVNSVPFGIREPHVLRPGDLVAPPAFHARAGVRADTDKIDRAMADVVIGVAHEVLRAELPIRRHDPFLNAAEDLRTTGAPVAAIEQNVELRTRFTEVPLERRRLRIPRREDRTLVVRQLRDFDQPPLRAIEHAVVERIRHRNTDELAVERIAPRVVGAGEQRRIALVVAAHFHSAVTARIQEDMDRAGAIPAEEHGLFAHARLEKIARLRNLTLVADEQPSAAEQVLEFVPVRFVAHEDVPAYRSQCRVDHFIVAAHLRCPAAWLATANVPVASSQRYTIIAFCPIPRCELSRKS